MNEAVAYFYRGRVCFFASEQTRARFAATPHLYAPEMAFDVSAFMDTGDSRGLRPTDLSSAVKMKARHAASGSSVADHRRPWPCGMRWRTLPEKPERDSTGGC
jgi:hypothetical protein